MMMKSSVIEIRHDSVFLCQAAGMRSQKHKFHHSVWNMDAWRRCVGPTEARRPRSTKSPAAARPKLRADDIREAPAFPKEGGDVCQIAVRLDLTLHGGICGDGERVGAAQVRFLSVSHRVFDLGTMHAYFSDMCQTADW